MDISPKLMPPDSSAYTLNQEVSVNPNGGANGGASLGKQTPFAANFPACEKDHPAGENYTILKYESKRTQQAYNGVYNTNGVNWIERVNADGTCEIVYQGDCLKFNPAPRNAVEPFRCGMRVEKICKNWAGKELLWVDGDMVSPGCLDVEASIATGSFTTPFFDICPDPCAMIQLCVPEICGCIHAEFIPLLAAEASLSNYIVDKGFKFMVKHIYYDGRASEFSDWSSLYYQQRDCLGGLVGAARCLKLRIPIGNPMVEKIVIAFSEDGGTTWYECETVEKYKAYNNSQQQWYERELSETVSSTFSDIDCSFDYIFCNDKNRKTIDDKQASRVRNPIPRKAQTLIQFTDKFAFFNYEDGICPLPETETDKLSVSIQCDEPGCISEMVELTIRAILYSPIPHPGLFPLAIASTGLIYRLGGESGQEADNPLDTAYYSSYVQGVNGLTNSGQQFYDRTRNFIVYVEGTEYWAEMKQWRADANFLNRREIGVEPELGNADKSLSVYAFLRHGGFYYNEAKIKVPKGTKGFLRMVSNQASDGFGDRQNTSLGIYGILNNINAFRTHSGPTLSNYPPPDARIGEAEIYFDSCNGNVVTDEAFLIRDNVGVQSIYAGYVKDNLGFPVEGLTMKNPGVSNPTFANYGYVVTDHNGFYSFEAPDNTALDIYGETACNVWGVLQSNILFGQESATTMKDIVIDDSVFPYSTTRFAEIDVTIVDCQNNLLPNVRVVISGSKNKDTNASGVARFRIRNHFIKPRIIRTFIANNGSCITEDCSGNCNPCADDIQYITPTCYTPSPTINVGTIQINDTILANKNGLKPGGLYKWAYRVKGSCGRVSAAYEFQEMNIPRLQETLGYKFCKFNYDTTQGGTTIMQLPEWGECLEILRTENLNPYELQWIVDKVERTIGGDLKLTIQSLNDYNTRFFDKTNTIYQYNPGDRVEFISNNGQILDASVYGILNYLILSPFFDTALSGKLDPPADYFNQILVKDDGKLGIIKEGAIIELQRPKQATVELNPFFDICCVLPLFQVSNGDGTFHTELLNPVGEFKTFDTYFIRRNIAGYVENFQHHSPSDFWGTKLTDAGRAFFENQYENEKRYGRYATINSPTQLNYFGDLIKKFDGDEQGDIIAANIVDDNILLLIAEYDCFIAQAANDLLRIDNAGIVRATPADALLSDPQAQPIGNYGCQYEDVGSIIFYDGGASWCDVNRMAYVKHNYNFAKDVSEGKVQTFIQKRSQQIRFLNSSASNDLDKLRFCTGQNSNTKSIFITIKRLRDSGINNEKKPYLKLNDTLIYNPDADEFLGFASFTGEGYSNLSISDDSGCCLISYFNGVPYIHPVITTKFNEFFGQAVDWMVSVCANQFENKEKAFIAIEQQCETFFIVDSVETDKPNYSSEIPAIKFKKYGKHWNAAFLGNKNSRGGLFGTELPKGYYAKVLFVRDNTLNLAYNSIDDTKRTAYSELDLLLIKTTVLEQSGFTNNI